MRWLDSLVGLGSVRVFERLISVAACVDSGKRDKDIGARTSEMKLRTKKLLVLKNLCLFLSMIVEF